MQYPTTYWTDMGIASVNGDTKARKALDEFCRRYRRPILVTIIAAGWSREDAEDLSQEFFAWLLSRKYIRKADRMKGSFRCFLRQAISYFLSNQRRFRQAAKRNPGAPMVQLDADEDIEFQAALSTEPIPDAVFDRDWAQNLLLDCIARLEEEYRKRGREVLYRELVTFLGSDADEKNRLAIAERLGMSVEALNMAVSRLRADFRKLMRSAVACTVSAPHEIESELRYVWDCLVTRQAGPSSNPKELACA